MIEEGKQLFAYEISGKYDEQEMKDTPLDGVWCSIYDVVRLAKDGIIDPLDPLDEQDAIAYLKKAMPYTKDHQHHVFEF